MTIFNAKKSIQQLERIEKRKIVFGKSSKGDALFAKIKKAEEELLKYNIDVNNQQPNANV